MLRIRGDASGYCRVDIDHRQTVARNLSGIFLREMIGQNINVMAVISLAIIHGNWWLLAAAAAVGQK